jgi:hypothetical protein
MSLASEWTAADVTNLWFGIGLLAIFLSVVVYLAIRGMNSDDMVRTGIATWSKVSYVRISCIIGFIVGIAFIVASVLFYYG